MAFENKEHYRTNSGHLIHTCGVNLEMSHQNDHLIFVERRVHPKLRPADKDLFRENLKLKKIFVFQYFVIKK